MLTQISRKMGTQVGLHFREQDHSTDTRFRDFGRAILDTLPPHALLLETGDHVSHSLRYVQEVEGYRRDVRVLDQKLLAYAWQTRIVQRHFPEVTLPGLRWEPEARRRRRMSPSRGRARGCAARRR